MTLVKEIDPDILSVIREIKTRYENKGFRIVGIFGSFSRGDYTEDSDVDILYQLSPEFYKKYPGMKFFKLYEQVKIDLEDRLGRSVDLADADALGQAGKKYILSEVINVEKQ